MKDEIVSYEQHVDSLMQVVMNIDPKILQNFNMKINEIRRWNHSIYIVEI